MNSKISNKFNSYNIKVEKSYNEIKAFEIESCLISMNDKGYYQIRTLFILSTLWGLVPVIAVLLPFFTIQPEYLCRVRNADISDFKPCSHEAIHDPDFEYIIDKNNSMYHTWIIDFDLTCSNEYLIIYIGSTYFTGMIISNLIIQKLCTKYGRLPVLKTIILVYIFNNIMLSFFQMNNILIFYSLIAGFVYSGISIPAFVLNFEYTSKKSKSIFASIINSSYSIGAMIQIGVFYIFKNWKVSILTNIFIFTIIYLYTNQIKESPSYLLTNGKYKELLQNFEEIARLNHREEQFLCYLKSHPTFFQENKTDINKDCRKNTIKKNKNLLNMVISDDERILMFNVGLSWFANSLIQYGTVFNIKKYGGNIFINAVSLYTASIVSILTSSFVIDIYGSKKSLIIYYIINLIANGMITFIHVFEINTHVENIPCYFLLFLSSFSTSAIGSLNYIYTAELYKDTNMVSAISIGSLINRIAGMLSPLLSQVSYPTFIFTLLSVITIILFMKD